MSTVVFAQEKNLSAEEFIDVMKRSTLSQRRPADDIDRIKQMLLNADLIVTARVDGKLVGVARSLTDFSYCTYLSDLAVDVAHQKSGIGKELIRKTKQAAPLATLILLSAPAATEYYPKIGMNRHEHCFVLKKEEELR